MKRKTDRLTSIPANNHDTTDPALQRQIADRAYQLFEQRGHSHGNDVGDWLRAEHEVRAAWGRKRTAARSTGTTKGRPRTKTRKAA